MSKRQYPCIAYELTSNYNVRKLKLDRPYSDSSDRWGAYTASGKYYRADVLFDTRKAAIKAGRSRINRRLKNLAAAQNEIGKHIDALNKAEKEAA